MISLFNHLSNRFLKHIIYPWLYLFHGPWIIQNEFDKAKGRPFEVFAPDGRYVFVSSVEHVKELDTAPDTVLSLQAASKQMLQPRYTMHGFDWFDRRGTEGVGFVRAIRTLLTNNLPQILPDLGVIIRHRFAELHSEHPVVNGSRHSPAYEMILKLVVLANATSFFGKELGRNERFMASALVYIEETLIGAEIIRLTPRPIVPIVGWIISRRLHSHQAIFNTLLPIVEQRCQERELARMGKAVPKHADCIQWIMETSPKKNPWSAKRVVHELMAIWFGSVHALSTTITFAIHDLCLHPEYVASIRKEVETHYAEFEHTGQGLDVLDSFIKESARLNPVESMSTRRQALQPFQLSDGTKINIGDWACTPVRAICQDAVLYPEPSTFNGFRFVNPNILKNINIGPDFGSAQQAKPSSLTDVDNTWHVWGTGRMACPGRYYATAIMKLIMSQIILNYNCSLVNSNTQLWFTWRSSMLPNPQTRVIFTLRERKNI